MVKRILDLAQLRNEEIKMAELKYFNALINSVVGNDEERDEEWRAIGLAAPARRALVDAKLYKVSDLRKISLEDLTNLHGMGKSAIARLKVVMHGKKITFRN